MNVLNDLLSLLLVYGYPIVVGVVAIGELGIPVPASSVLLAAGSFTSDGSLNIFLLITLVTTTAVVGDIAGYYIGKHFGRYVLQNKYIQTIGVTQESMIGIDRFMKKWGLWWIFMTRWLITPLGVPVNIIAGIHKYPFFPFAFFVFFGELLWATLYIYLGHFFGISWVILAEYITTIPQILALSTIGIALLMLAMKIRHIES